MIKLQQYTFRLRPQPAQWAGIAALDVDMQPHIDAYRRKRDLIVGGLAEDYELVKPGRGVLRLSQGPLGHRRAVRPPGDRGQAAGHPRQHLQPPRHALPHLLCGRRRHDRARHRSAAQAGATGAVKLKSRLDAGVTAGSLSSPAARAAQACSGGRSPPGQGLRLSSQAAQRRRKRVTPSCLRRCAAESFLAPGLRGLAPTASSLGRCAARDHCCAVRRQATKTLQLGYNASQAFGSQSA